MADGYEYVDKFNEAAVNVQGLESALNNLERTAGTVSDTVAKFSAIAGKLDFGSEVRSLEQMDALMNKLNGSMRDKAEVASKLQRIWGGLNAKQKGQLKSSADALGVQKQFERVVQRIEKGQRSQYEIMKKMRESWNKLHGKLDGVSRHFTGMSLTLGGILLKLLETYNQMRKIHGLAMMAAGRLGRTPAAIKAAKQGIFDLRREFRMSYEEAAGVVTKLSDMGFHAKDLAGNKYIQKGFKLPKQYTDEYKALMNESMEMVYTAKTIKEINEKTAELDKKSVKLQKEITKEMEIQAKRERLRRANFKEIVPLATELTAIQTGYRISVEQSARAIRDIQMGMGKSREEARSVYGVTTMLADELSRADGYTISAAEIVSDWTELINKVRIYKTDLMGVWGVYKSMVREKFAKQIGLGDVSPDVRRDIAQGIGGMAMGMGMGWKAFLGMRAGLGRSPVEAGMRFEKMAAGETPGGMMKAFSILTREVERLGASASPEEREFRMREILRNMFQGTGMTEEGIRELAEATAKGELTSGKIAARADELVAEAKNRKQAEEDWITERKKLVDYAGKAHTAVQSIEELIKKYVTDKLMKVINSILTVARKIYEFLRSESPEEEIQDEASKRLLEQGGPVVSGSTLTKFGKALKRTGALGEASIGEIADLSRPGGYKMALEAMGEAGGVLAKATPIGHLFAYGAGQSPEARAELIRQRGGEAMEAIDAARAAKEYSALRARGLRGGHADLVTAIDRALEERQADEAAKLVKKLRSELKNRVHPAKSSTNPVLDRTSPRPHPGQTNG